MDQDYLKGTQENTSLVEFFQTVIKLKSVQRQGWKDKLGLLNPESVADHTFSMCAVSMVLSDILRLDTERVMKMVILHDLAESIIGDYMPSEISRKQKILKEKKAMNYILYCIPSNVRRNYKKIWHEYLQNKTDVAQLVHRIDKFEMLLQANQYVKEGYSNKLLAQFFDSVKRQTNDEK